jgi:hypothetical protein
MGIESFHGQNHEASAEKSTLGDHLAKLQDMIKELQERQMKQGAAEPWETTSEGFPIEPEAVGRIRERLAYLKEMRDLFITMDRSMSIEDALAQVELSTASRHQYYLERFGKGDPKALGPEAEEAIEQIKRRDKMVSEFQSSFL